MTEPQMYSPVRTRYTAHNHHAAPEGQQYYTAEYVAWVERKYRKTAQEAPRGPEGESAAQGMQIMPGGARWATTASQQGKKPCAVCGTPFQPRTSVHRYCGGRCRNKAKKQTARTQVCEECGRTFEATNGRSVVCGPGCQVIRKARQNEESRKRRRAA